MGIPCGRRKVCSLGQGDKKKKLEFIQNFIGTSDTDCKSLTAAENKVTAEYDPSTAMSMKDKHNFKVSFVAWVMGHLLAPTKKHNVGSDRFWGALMTPDEINQFNWADYVIDELISAAIDVQNAIKQNRTVNTIKGCPILLQILYFESINMGSLNRPKGISPRVKVYDGKSLGLLIAADKASYSAESGNATWGSSVRRLPELRNKSLAEIFNHALNTDTPSETDIINDLGKYLRDKCGDKVWFFLFTCHYGCYIKTIFTLKFHFPDVYFAVCRLELVNARCTLHFKRLRFSIQQDTIELAGKLFSDADVSIPTVASEPNRLNLKGRWYLLVCYNAFVSFVVISKLAGPTAAHSKPSRTPVYGRSLLNIKRGYELYRCTSGSELWLMEVC